MGSNTWVDSTKPQTAPAAVALTVEQEKQILTYCDDNEGASYDSISKFVTENYEFTPTKDQIHSLVTDRALGIK